MSLIGKTLGQYRIVEPIGAGGMAAVYKAYQPGLDRYVAIKILPAQYALTPGFKERFFHEAKAVAQLSHPNILPVYDVGIEEDISYFVMKYVPGRTLHDVMVDRSLALAQTSRYISQVAAALNHAHERGIIHRDIKPSNILVEDDWLFLADFGLAKIVEGNAALTGTGAIMGTPAYISPEQASGKVVDHRSDIYSLGIVLYEMVTGRVPYEGETPMGVLVKHIYEPLPMPRSVKPDLPEEVERVILKALAKEPADRYDRAGALAEALRQAVEQAPAVASTPSIPATFVSPAPPKSSPVGQPVTVSQQPGVTTPPIAPAPRRSSVPWLWLAGGGLLVLLVAAVLSFFAIRAGINALTGPETPTRVAAAETAAPALEKKTPVAAVMEAGSQTVTPTPVPPNPTATETTGTAGDQLATPATAAPTDAPATATPETSGYQSSQPVAVPVTLSTMQSNEGWMITLTLADQQVKEILYKFDDAADFKSTGLMPNVNPATGLPFPNPFFVVSDLAPGSHTVAVKYVDLQDQEQGPFELTFDTTAEIVKTVKYILEVTTPTSWVSFRDYDGKLLLYFTHLLSYRHGLTEIRYSLNEPSLSEIFPFKPWTGTSLPSFGDDDLVYMEVPADTTSIYVQLVFLDGTESEVRQFNR